MTSRKQQTYRVAFGRTGTLAGGRPLVAGDVIELDAAAIEANQHNIDEGILIEHVESKPETKDAA